MTAYTEDCAATIRNLTSSLGTYLGAYSAGLKLLMHMNGSDGSTSFVDSSVINNQFQSWGVSLSTSVKQHGTASANFGTGGTSYLSIYPTIDANNFAFGTGDFTILLHFRLSSTGYKQFLIDITPLAGGGVYPQIYISSTNYLTYSVNGTARITSATLLTTGVWHQVVLSRTGTTTRLYLDGAQEGSTYTDSNNYLGANNRPAIGTYGYSLGTDTIRGYIDELGVWKGQYIPIGEFQSLEVGVSLGYDITATVAMIDSCSATIRNVSPGITSGQEYSATTTIKNTASVPSAAVAYHESPAATIINRPISPSVQIYITPTDPATLGSLIISGTASQTMTDKMMRAQFQVDRATSGVTPNVYFKNIEFKIPDYTGALQTVFVGFFPSGSTTFGAEGDYETFTAYDPAWYLTMQYLTDDNMVLLTPDNQLVAYKYRLYYTHPSVYWKVGQWIEGATNGNIGKIIEDHLVGAWPVNEGSYIILESVGGVLFGGHYFADDEILKVNGVACAYADGNEVDVTGVPPIVYPDDYVARLLGADNTGSQYEKITGIIPYRLENLPAWSSVSTPPAVEFVFEEKTTKIQAIERICKYIKYVFMVKIVGGYPCAYFLSEANIDNLATGLDLPAMVGIANPDPYLVSPVTLERKGEEKYNRITVRCQSLTGVWYESVQQSDEVAAGEDLPIEYYEVNQDIATQADCDLRCADLFAYYSEQIKTWKATFLLRSDFRLLQKLQFSGYGAEIPDGIYRIVGITYNYSDAGTTNRVECTIILDSQFKFYLNLNRVFTDSISEIQSIAQAEIDKRGAIEAGTANTVTGAVVSLTTESGVTKTGRDPSV